MKRHPLILTVVLLLVPLFSLAACARDAAADREIRLAPLSEMPIEIQRAPTSVREAYRFAVANPELVSQFPCYCGCGSVAHESNLDCYIRESRPDGTVVFDNHAFG
jgi:hypothetical protein